MKRIIMRILYIIGLCLVLVGCGKQQESKSRFDGDVAEKQQDNATQSEDMKPEPMDKSKIWVCTSEQVNRTYSWEKESEPSNISRIVYSYDEEGHCIGEQHFLLGEISMEQTYEYDINGNKVKEITHQFPNDKMGGLLGEDNIQVTNYVYNDKNQLIEQSSTNDSKYELTNTYGNTHVFFEYDVRGLQTAMRFMNDDGQFFDGLSSWYDGDGYLKGYSSYGDMSGGDEYYYDNLGHLEIDYSFSDTYMHYNRDNFGNVVYSKSEFRETRYQNFYDAYGNLVKTIENNKEDKEITVYSYVTLKDYLDGILSYPEETMPIGSEGMQNAIDVYAAEDIFAYLYEDFDGDDFYEMLAQSEVLFEDGRTFSHVYLYDNEKVTKLSDIEYTSQMGQNEQQRTCISRIDGQNLFSVYTYSGCDHYRLDANGNFSQLDFHDPIVLRADGTSYYVKETGTTDLGPLWKKVMITFEDNTVKEYPLEKISEREFMKLGNADTVIKEAFERLYEKNKEKYSEIFLCDDVYDKYPRGMFDIIPSQFFASDRGHYYVGFSLKMNDSGSNLVHSKIDWNSMVFSAEFQVVDNQLVLLEVYLCPVEGEGM